MSAIYDVGEQVSEAHQNTHFDICHGAQSLYKKITDEKLKDDAVKSAKLHDALFAMEKQALKSGASEENVKKAKEIADSIMELAQKMGLKAEHQYVQGHVDKIKDTVKENIEEDIEAKDGTEFKIKLKHLLQKHATNLKRGKSDTEFKLTLKHLLDKHVSKGGEEKDD